MKSKTLALVIAISVGLVLFFVLLNAGAGGGGYEIGDILRWRMSSIVGTLFFPTIISAWIGRIVYRKLKPQE